MVDAAGRPPAAMGGRPSCAVVGLGRRVDLVERLDNGRKPRSVRDPRTTATGHPWLSVGAYGTTNIIRKIIRLSRHARLANTCSFTRSTCASAAQAQLVAGRSQARPSSSRCLIMEVMSHRSFTATSAAPSDRRSAPHSKKSLRSAFSYQAVLVLAACHRPDYAIRSLRSRGARRRCLLG